MLDMPPPTSYGLMPYASLDTLYYKLGRKNILHALHGQPTTAGFLANPEDSVMCKKLAGERGTPRAGPGWQSPAAAMPTGGFFGRIRTGYKCDAAGRQWDMTGYESWRDRAARWIGWISPCRTRRCQPPDEFN